MSLVTPPLPAGLCGIEVPPSGRCVFSLGHLGRCSWDKAPAIDPVYETEGSVNLLAPDYDPNHGTRVAYKDGCHCLRCRAANAEYQETYRAKRAVADGARRAWLRARGVDAGAR